METAHCKDHTAFNEYCPSCIEAKRDAAKPSTEPPSTDQKPDTLGQAQGTANNFNSSNDHEE